MEDLYSTLVEHPDLNAKLRSFQRGDFLIHAGDQVQSFYLILEGLIRAFYVSEHEEHTIRFGYQGSLITSIPGFYDGSRSEFYLQAIRKTEAIEVRRDDFMAALKSDLSMAAWYTRSLEDLARQQVERELDLLTSSPIERLRRVRDRSPQLFQEVPLKYIASYLRMTPETLSRILHK